MARTQKHILYIIPRFVAGGAERMVLHYAELLPKDYFNITVASTADTGPLEKLFRRTGVTVLPAAAGRRRAFANLFSFFAKNKPDIIHTHLLGGDIFGYLFKIFGKHNFIWISTQHNVEFKTSWGRRFLWKMILKKADKIIAVADKVKQYDITHFSLPAKKIEILKNGIDTHLLKDIPLPKLEQPWQLGIIGRLQPQKGHQDLFEALSRIKSYAWQLHIYGDGPDAAGLNKYALAKGIGDRLMWHGVETDIKKMFSSFDIAVQPSLWEGLSLVMIEAMAAGRAIIASDPAGEELISDGISGLIIPSGNPQKLADILEYCFTHAPEMIERAAAARAVAIAQFDIRDHVAKLAHLYQAYE